MPDPRERRFEIVADRIDVDRGATALLKAEIMNHKPRETGVRQRDAVRPRFVDDLEPHVLEHRQHVGQRDFALRVIKLEGDRIGGRIGRLIQMKPDAAVGSDAFDLVKIKQHFVG